MQLRPFDRHHPAQLNTENPREMNMRFKRSTAGFTLIEVLVVSILVAVIAAIALPVYQQQIREARRAEARRMLLDVMNREHRFFADNSFYTTSITTSLNFSPAESENGHYNLSALVDQTTLAGDPKQVKLTATPQGAQAVDTDCATLTLSTTGAKDSTGGGSKCW
jgi:type IV pilus assembly protein PilE